MPERCYLNMLSKHAAIDFAITSCGALWYMFYITFEYHDYTLIMVMRVVLMCLHTLNHNIYKHMKLVSALCFPKSVRNFNTLYVCGMHRTSVVHHDRLTTSIIYAVCDYYSNMRWCSTWTNMMRIVYFPGTQCFQVISYEELWVTTYHAYLVLAPAKSAECLKMDGLCTC